MPLDNSSKKWKPVKIRVYCVKQRTISERGITTRSMGNALTQGSANIL